MIPEKLQVGDKIFWDDVVETVIKTRDNGTWWQVSYNNSHIDLEHEY